MFKNNLKNIVILIVVLSAFYIQTGCSSLNNIRTGIVNYFKSTYEVKLNAKILMTDGSLQKIASTRFYLLKEHPLVEIIFNTGNDIDKVNYIVNDYKQAEDVANQYEGLKSRLNAESSKAAINAYRSNWSFTYGYWSGRKQDIDSQINNVNNTLTSYYFQKIALNKELESTIKNIKDAIRFAYATPKQEAQILQIDTDEKGEAIFELAKRSKYPLWIVGYTQLNNNNLCFCKELKENDLRDKNISITANDIEYNLSINDLKWLINLIELKKSIENPNATQQETEQPKTIDDYRTNNKA